jgi:hypothetical protein
MTRQSVVALIVLLSLFLALLVLAILLLLSQFSARQQSQHRYGVPAFAVAYAGLDYYYPSDYFGGCPNWTWLQDGCYTHNPQGGTTEQAILRSDVAFIAQSHLGGFQRVWAMLDQGIRWDQSGRYQGLDPAYLANLDDALAIFHGSGIGVDVVLLEASKGSSDKNQFQTQALDGGHSALRAGYLQALKDFAAHLAANTVDSQTVAVVDTCNECYFQLERFGLSDAAIHSFVHDAYTAVKSGDPSLAVTVSDVTRLLKDYGTWGPQYNDAVDVYDIHAYSDTPWNETALWAKAQSLPHPWFSGEAGCAPGHVDCTYKGDVACSQPTACALSVDQWWLANLRHYGAKAVLVEERNTAFAYPKGPTSPTLTAVGRMMQQFAGSAAPGLSACRTGER